MTETAQHFVVADGITCLQVGATDRGQPICYKAGDVLPFEVGAFEWQANPHNVVARPGDADESDPHDPTGGGVATVRLPDAGAGRGMTAEERSEFLAQVKATVRSEMSQAQAKSAQHDATVGQGNLNERGRVDAESKRRGKGKGR